MPIAALFLTIVLYIAAFSQPAIAQGAATGGTNDSGSPTMVFPIRPRDEPATVTAVPNRPRHAYPTVLQRRYYYYGHRRRR
jgi:hypothetical protein